MTTYDVFMKDTDGLTFTESVEDIDRHQIDEHNNLHLMDESYSDIVVFKHDQWNKFVVRSEKE